MSTESNPAGTMARLQAAEAELRRLREQEPVAHAWKTIIDGEPMILHPVGLAPNKAYSVPLYAAPVPPPDVRELVEVLRGMMDAYMDLCDESEPNYHSFQFRQERWDAARAALAKFRGQP